MPRGNFTREVLGKILVEHPGYVGERVQKHPIHVLKLMEPVMALVGVQAQQGAHLKVGIMALNVGEGVVVDVVLYLPEIRIAAQPVEQVR